MSMQEFLNAQSGGQTQTERMKILENFYKKEGIELKTELSDLEIDCVCQLLWMDKYVKDNWGLDMGYAKICTQFMTLKVSRNRMGRKEFVEVMKTYMLDVFGQNSIARRLISR